MSGIFRKSAGLIAIAFLLLSCSSAEGGRDISCELTGDLMLYGGRNRALVCWNGVNNKEYTLRFLFPSGVTLEAGNRSCGREFVSGLQEGDCSVKAQLLSGGNVAGERELSVVVFGSRYEKGLGRWLLDECSVNPSAVSCRFCASVPDGLYGEEFMYKNKAGKLILNTLRYDSEAVSHEFEVKDFEGIVSHRTVYVPEPETGDRFYTSYVGLEDGELGEGLPGSDAEGLRYPCKTVDGYRGIWFDLGQATAYGSKYCGGLGTYTMKHIPMAIYAPEVDKTFFVYGGTTSENARHLLCMVGCYDHVSGLLQKPRIVMDKNGVDDPHDDPTIQIDKDGYIWVFVSGRSTKRDGRIYRSELPYDIRGFELVNQFEMAYPQILYSEEKGFFFFFTRYEGKRRLFYQSSADGRVWSPTLGLADIKGGKNNSGHYQISNICGTKLCTAFNRHINGNVDTRTSIYYLQSTDWGQTWTTAAGEKVNVPVTEVKSNALVMDYESQDKNCYIKDLNFDRDGNPIVLYLISDNHKTGPDGGKREWHTMHWDGTKWNVTKFAESSHCYDSGSIWVEGDTWTIIAPTQPSSDQALFWGAGGEIQQWTSTDSGKTWTMTRQMTQNSGTNHTYVRRPFYADEGFWAYWADGRTDKFSRSNLYFSTKEGRIYRMPYDMTQEWQKPEEYK